MNTTYFIAAAVMAVALAGLLVWALRGSSRRTPDRRGLAALETAPEHLRNMPQIHQAMSMADLEYVCSKGGRAMRNIVHRERRHVVLLYLRAIRQDFEQSLRIARIIAVLSPEVSGTQEYERLRLSVVFNIRYEMVKLGLLLGRVQLPQVTVLGEMATSLAIKLEEAMAKMGERAALAAELALQSRE